MSRESSKSFRLILLNLWFRLMSLGAVAFVFAAALWLAPGKAQGWSFYLTVPEVLFEILWRLLIAGLVGIAAGTVVTVVTVLVFSFLWGFPAREQIAKWATRITVVLIVFLDGRFALITLFTWSQRGLRFEPWILILYPLVFLFVVFIRPTRLQLLSSLDPFITPKASRRTVLALVTVAVLLAGFEFVAGRHAAPVKAATVSEQPKHNILLVTFDALDAEDLSLYGRGLPTTPNIDAFASKGTVFTNFYSGSTFTTPSIATMMTGRYPSQTGVYQLQGRISPGSAEKTLPYLLKSAGYHTGAFLTNPFAYYLNQGFEQDYDVLPEPVFRRDGLNLIWKLTKPFHQDTGFGSRIDEYSDFEGIWSMTARQPGNASMRYRPDVAFQNARKLIDKMPDGYFVWVHLITPHNPYLPDEADRGRFLPASKLTTYEEEYGGRWKPHYTPDQQPLVDERRLRYDEFIASADRAFGAFISDLERSGKLNNTTVVFSADHGESFEGGVYQHSSPYLTRPVLHIPLIIRTPGQTEQKKVSFVADQTCLAPTLLDLAGQPTPDWMSGKSLVPLLNGDTATSGQGLAFTQYLETNSVFRPLHHGTVGVIDGRFQYMVYLDSGKTEFRPLNQAQFWNLDLSATNPERAQQLRAAIIARFPELHLNK